VTLTNAQIAAQLGQLAQLLHHRGENRFKVKAYRNAADALRIHPDRIAELLAAGRPLPKIRGVGAGIAAAIEEIATSGSLSSVRTLEEKLPAGTAAIAEAARITVRDAQRLVKALDIATPDELRSKLEAGEVGPAVGPRLEFKVRHGLQDVRRLLWIDAHELSEHFRAVLADIRGVSTIEPAGSLRRSQDTVGTLRFVVRASNPGRAQRALAQHAGIAALDEPTPGRLTARLAAGPLLVVRFADDSDWGTALVEETGSDEHLDEVKRLAPRSARRPSPSEEAWYTARALAWITPELREGRGEVAAALAGSLPALVELADIKGDLHAHTTASDGADTLEEMVAAARARGYSYLAITDHSKSLKITGGLDEGRLAQQGREIDALNRSLRGFRVLKGSEVDILADGSLDFPDNVLRTLDVVMGSIHSLFNLDKTAQTERLIRAVANPGLTCLGHLTGRKLLSRPGYELDLEAVLGAVKRHAKLLEINSSPDRLDIDDHLAKRARELGIPILINTDAHSTREFGFMTFGIQQARRGWQSAETVLNTLPLTQLLKRLGATRTRTGKRAG
jgi:DNA polymerase (family 10)